MIAIDRPLDFVLPGRPVAIPPVQTLSLVFAAGVYLPPMLVAASWKARLGIPLLMWTPPLSLVVCMKSLYEPTCGSLPSFGSSYAVPG